MTGVAVRRWTPATAVVHEPGDFDNSKRAWLPSMSNFDLSLLHWVYSAMLARAGRGDDALTQLEVYRRAFILRNGFTITWCDCDKVNHLPGG